MRMIVIKQATDAQALGARLAVDAAAREKLLPQLQRLNPHLDFKRLERGTVLLVPDEPGLNADQSSSVGGQAFEAFRDQVVASMEAAAGRVREGHAGLAAERAEVGAVLKTAAFKRVLDADPDLKPLVDAAAEVFDDDQRQAKEIDRTLKALQDGALAELGMLANRLA